jgi:hypothetical protein
MKKGERRGGRAKGTPNTVTRILKEGIILAGENIGNRLSLGHLDIVLLQRLKFEHGITTLDGKATLAQRLLHFLNGLVRNVDFLVCLLDLHEKDTAEQGHIRWREFQRCPFQVADQSLLLFHRSLRELVTDVLARHQDRLSHQIFPCTGQRGVYVLGRFSVFEARKPCAVASFSHM